MIIRPLVTDLAEKTVLLVARLQLIKLALRALLLVVPIQSRTRTPHGKSLRNLLLHLVPVCVLRIHALLVPLVLPHNQ